MGKKVAAYSPEITVVYQIRTSLIFIGPGLLGFLGKGLCVYNVFKFKSSAHHRAYIQIGLQI